MTPEDVPPGSAVAARIDGHDLLVCNVDGELFAVDDLCTHDRLPIGDCRIRGGSVQCPRHGARFDVRTGAVLEGPALVDIAVWAVDVVDGEIRVAGR